jgi:hypothetical protein
MKWGDTLFGATVGTGIMVFLLMTGCGLSIKWINESETLKHNIKIEQHE